MWRFAVNGLHCFQAPGSKIRSLCNELAIRLLDSGYTLQATFPAVVANDVESLIDATISVDISFCAALATVFRHSIGNKNDKFSTEVHLAEALQ